MTFTEQSPLSPIEAQNRRNRSRFDSSERYDLAGERFSALVPEAYSDQGRPWALLVWVSSGKTGGPPRGWDEMLASNKVIWIGADEAGNDRPVSARMGLALDAVHNFKKQYNIDESRIYIAGVSGGGKIASMLAILYPDIFGGAISIVGVTYFRPIPLSADPSKSWQGTFERPGGALLERARNQSRIVLLTGSNDFNRDSIRDTYNQGFVRDGFQRVDYVEVPGLGHGVPETMWISAAIMGIGVVEPPQEEKRTNPIAAPVEPAEPRPRPPATQPQRQPASAETEAERLLSLAQNYERNNLPAQAIQRLEAIVRDYPATKAAATARQSLERLKSQPRPAR